MKQNSLIESIKARINSLDDELKALVVKLILDYEKKSLRIDKVIEQSDKQQFELLKLNEKLEESYKTLERVSQTDKLTSLFNRLKCEEILIDLIHHQSSFSLMIIDVDNFKSMNEKFDILTANKFLVQLSKLIQKNIQPNSVLGRWSGDSFIVLNEKLASDAMIEIAEEICDRVENYFFDSVGKATVSIGVCSVQKNKSLMDVVQSFDMALRRAKMNGKNQVSI